MNDLSWTALWIWAAAYLIGSISPGYWLVRWRGGGDIRRLGSGATGARNVGRTLGRGGLAAVAVADLVKGMLPILLARQLSQPDLVLSLALFWVVVGHVWSLFLGFRGGKGLATGFGALLLIHPVLAGAALAGAAVLSLLLRQPTLAVMVVALLLPIAAALAGLPSGIWLGLILVVPVVLYAHRQNLRSLWRREAWPPTQ